MRTLFRIHTLLIALCFSLGMTAQSKIYYVSPASSGNGDGSSWANATTLIQALNNAVAGDQIWVQGFETVTHESNLYVTPAKEGFTLKSGVQLYGGFKGTETKLTDRETLGKPYQLKYRSVLSGDLQNDDKVDNVDLIFPANTTRSDNTTHVLTLNMEPTQTSGNNNTYPTVVNGFTITGGQADGTDEKGGGIYVTGNNTDGGNFRIERCFLFNNYATQGGAVYVSSEVQNVNNGESLINQCVIYNNAAGERAAVENQGGGVYLAGEATVVNTSIFNNGNGGVRLSSDSKVVNATIARNTGAGVDLTTASNSTNVYNSIIWGNTSLSAEHQPTFQNSAYHEVTADDKNSNVYVAKENRDAAAGPMFDAPSVKTSYDRDFDWLQSAYPLWSWNVLEGSVMIDKGDNAAYQTSVYGNEDMAGNPRISGDRISVGAYEYQYLPASRIRYVRQGATGDGSSWANASGDLQKMIDELAESTPSQTGEVWVAAGTYTPQSQLISGTAYSASFRMRDGISVYGGFAGTESSKLDRPKKEGAMPWDFTNQTILEAAYYNHGDLAWTNNKWTLTSDSRHVVWFAPMSGESDFANVTTLDGVTIQGGYAQGGTGMDDFMTDRGAGVYMDGANAYLSNCIVKENYATGNGGGVYLKNGRVQTSLIYNNNADADGGAVYVENRGLVHRSMLANNSALNGAGVYLHNGAEATGLDSDDHPEYLILSTCVVSNNTVRGNGAVYCDKGGVLMQNTITNNNCVTATDATDPNASQTGGIYIDEYALVVNSVLWNNQMGVSPNGTNIPMYARNPSADKVKFLYNAISGVNNAIWNNTLQEQTLSLVDENAGVENDGNSIGPRFIVPAEDMKFDLDNDYGVQSGWKDGIISYYWKPVDGSNLWARGMALGQLPDDVVLSPELDIEGDVFAQKPATGAFMVKAPTIKPSFEQNGSNYKLVLYIDAECTEPSHDGSSWAKAFRSLNNALAYCATLSSGDDVVGVNGTHNLSDIDFFEIRVLEGDLWPRYAFTNNDPKTATVSVPAMASGKPVYIYGGYHRNSDGTVVRDPLTYRSIINGNTEGKDITQGLYHCITVEQGAELVLDGFHVINGYAAGEASRQYGAGLLAHAGSTVTVRNCIFENNTAQEGAAIDAREATLTLQNCVVNNNTNTTTTASVITAQSLTMEHVTVANNIGAAPANTNNLYESSLSAGNTDAEGNLNTTNNNTLSLSTIGADGAKNFANPTNKVGATLGFDTYLGGYSSFRPLTSSADAGNYIINKASASTSLTTDITVVNDRDLGGVPDLGAYEAILPKKGSVFYVTQDGAGTMDGSSWENAIAGNLVYNVNNSSLVSGVNTTNSQYAGFYSSSCPYGETSNASKLFFDYLDAGDKRQVNFTYSTNGDGKITSISGIDIKNNRNEQYVGGLQYAVEKAAAAEADNEANIQVWVAGGTYTDWKGFVIRDKVTVKGGFPNEGAPGEDDRHPLLSAYISANEKDANLDKTKYETIIQVREDKPYTVNSSGEYAAVNGLPSRMRKPVLFQPDVCLPTVSPSGRESYTHVYVRNWRGYVSEVRTDILNFNGDDTQSNTYRYTTNDKNYKEYEGATWDGFTIRYGFLTDYSANRDGGAGVRMFRGVTLQNCVVADNFINAYSHYDYNKNNISAGMGAGIYCDGENSQIVNCFVLNNVNMNPNSSGGGANLMVGTSYNCVFANNYSSKDGGGVFLENAYFYNNTVAFNTINTGNGGGIRQWTRDRTDGLTQEMKLYNTILYGNNKDAIFSEKFTSGSNCYIQTEQPLKNSLGSKIANSQIETSLDSPFKSDNSQGENNYRLKSKNWCVNNGLENIDGVVLPSTDADFTDRIKDCALDVGAFELDNEENIKYTESSGVGTYYVSQNGAGIRSGQNPANAACATKLQAILADAGAKVSSGALTSAVVKVAGYENASFVYTANTLASATDPQSYTYVIPEGVTLMGGYYEGTYSNGSYNKDGWDDVTTGDNVRNPMKFRTVLSAVAKPTQGSTITQEVNGYHTVTFGAWPGTADLSKSAMIDGVWLTDGSANSMAGAGNPNTRGGGAIVPSGAHVRNCVVMDCEAIEGGGLYLMPGATVSGTLVMNNSAEDGGGVYADNTDVSADSRAHILSCTIANNEASSTGGGLYMEDGAVMNVNTVVFGNKAGSDKNVSGVVNLPFEDRKLASVFNIDRQTRFYPFNSCFVETQEMPSDFENRMLESDKSLYFADDYYRLKDYSLLIKHGLKNEYQSGKTDDEGNIISKGLVGTFNVAESDMQNIARVQTGNGAYRLDAGAFAYEGGILPDDLFTRIFVSQTANVTLPDGEDMNKYLGRSFYTSFSTLEDALGYIRSMRGKGHNDNFEILIAGGTYKPSNERTTTAAVTHDQRLCSFEVPQGVSIYGGFSGTENYSSGGIPSIPTTTGSVSVVNMGEISDIIKARAYSDFNQNNILEPWELANQTILSGQINVSSTAQNAYHVVFTDKGTATTVDPVVLDGLIVMYGQTDNKLSISTDNNEQGRGGGIYSNGVTYTISRCRLLNNTAVRGGAVFVRDADLNLSGCILAGNKTVYNDAKETTYNLTSRGGAAYVSGISKAVNLRAVNTLWANNESAEEGGAIGTNYAEGVSSSQDPLLYIMNNTFVRNKAAKNPVLYNHNAKSELVNTLIWGNDGASYDDATSVAEIYSVSHCASDVDYVDKFASGTNHNILLSIDNMGDNGPRFTNPSTVAGADGNSASSLWNPVAISVVTDAGDGTKHTTHVYPGETGHSDNTTTGAYQQWFTDNAGVTVAYMTNVDGTYVRYSGPRNENNEELCKPIDIGLYEYQYVSEFSTMPAIYVDTLSRGTGSGDGWANATDDLRGAIVGAANPTQKTAERVIYVRDGNYSWSRLSANSAYILNMSTNDNYSKSLTLKGSCTGSGTQQDFSKPTVIRNDGTTTTLMLVSANSKAVTFEGFTFINNTGTGMDASTGTDGSLTLKNCGFRISPTGLTISENSGKVLIYNTLFADGGTGLVAAGNTTVVNATFAQNATDLTGAPAVYNSVAWKNTNYQNLTNGTNNNVAIDGTVANDNVQNGPNFVDPSNNNKESRDYHIRPSVLLLNKGSNQNYIDYVVKMVSDGNASAIPATEVDLGNNARLVDNSIDVGAYEYEAPLQPIVYVKADLTGTADGKSWETALGDLQGAVDLAGLYALNHQDQKATGYVFVHGNYHDTGSLNLSLGNAKVYGGMNDERSSTLLGDNYTDDDVKAIVSDLLGKRKGMLENTNRSSLNNVTISADGVVDGFVVNGTATVNDGALSTSVVKNDVSGEADGLLYNSLVLGNVSDVKAVNVTVTGTIADVAGSGNNRVSVTETNTYVTDVYWKYQLMETSSDIDPTDTRTNISGYMMKVGHERDLIGNKRIRNTVDNGCFETWNIKEDYQITADDKPVGKSVVYVRNGQELSIADGVYPDGNAFNPGYLLLEHHAGLRGNGNYISLTNLAVERDVAKGGNDLAAMPFNVTGISPDGSDGTNESYELMRYSGSVRAAYSYQYDETDSEAWIKSSDQDFAGRGNTEGFLIENTSDNDITVRFSGNSYNEDGNDKTVSLKKYNYNDAWSTDNPGTGNRFTHKENMSWNLFGSPYLCAMNYSDMEYGRVLYGYVGGTYQTINTAKETEGYIPAGDAVFTQTATLKESETLNISASARKDGRPYAPVANLSIGISRAGATRAEDSACDDVLQLNAVPADEARNDFDIASDGVKWMAADSTAQLYATRSGARYSLLSAVSERGTVAVDVTLPEAGMYTFSIPATCDAGNYESVVLKDAKTGKQADLLEGGYDFTSVEAGTVSGRFTISFNRMLDDDKNASIRAWSPSRDKVSVSGVEAGDRIAVYSTAGVMSASCMAASSTETLQAAVSGVAIVEVTRDGKKIAVRKIRMR